MSEISVRGYHIKEYVYNTIIVGTGAAGYNGAHRLYSNGQKDIAIVTEHRLAGTSRNTGSDKQTYYKLSLGGGEADSVYEMAQTLFAGGCMDGDNALVEAALSAGSFLHLAELGVPFPTNRYGEYVGYKTDHDPRCRASSAGPLTSKLMVEALEQAVDFLNIPVYDGYQVIRILTEQDICKGLLCLNINRKEDENGCYVLFRCKNVLYATGGPAGIYEDVSFPSGHYGGSGVAFAAGVWGQNLTEWQHGLASLHPRWNVSGTYMQVLPRFISTAPDGTDEREFLQEYFDNAGELLSNVFLKGYEWPFDVRKAVNGSSRIDMIVYIERCIKGRRVFLDFRSNPFGKDIKISSLDQVAREYLSRAGGLFGTPVERLAYMNEPAVEFYKSKNIDLYKDMLEIALCAQHNNGGLSIDCWWQTNIKGFFAVGEVAGSHGVYRPGGSALNSSQVASTRAAQYIVCHGRGEPDVISLHVLEQIMSTVEIAKEALRHSGNTIDDKWRQARQEMSRIGGAIRNIAEIRIYLKKLKKDITSFSEWAALDSPKGFSKLYRLYDILVSQYVYLSSMLDYKEQGGISRGSALYLENMDVSTFFCQEECPLMDTQDKKQDVIQVTKLMPDMVCASTWRRVRPIPYEDEVFEQIWKEYRKNRNIV